MNQLSQESGARNHGPWAFIPSMPLALGSLWAETYMLNTSGLEEKPLLGLIAGDSRGGTGVLFHFVFVIL